MQNLGSTKNLRIVILECPYKNWHNQLTRKLFEDMIQLKIDGYESRWGELTMAMDATDFVADHLLICEETLAGELKILSASKSVTLSTSEDFHLGFMPVSLLEGGTNTGLHQACLDEILKNSKKDYQEIAYYSSWTIHPEIRKDRAASAEIKEIFSALSVAYHQSYNIKEMLGFSVPQFKTDIVFAAWGYRNVQFQNQDLAPIILPRYSNKELRLIHLNAFTPEVLEVAKKYNYMWMNRLTVKADEDVSKVA